MAPRLGLPHFCVAVNQKLVSLYNYFHMGVSKNRDFPPKSSILIGFSSINHPFWGIHIFWKHPYLDFADLFWSCRFSFWWIVRDFLCVEHLVPCSTFYYINQAYTGNAPTEETCIIFFPFVKRLHSWIFAFYWLEHPYPMHGKTGCKKWAIILSCFIFCFTLILACNGCHEEDLRSPWPQCAWWFHLNFLRPCVVNLCPLDSPFVWWGLALPQWLGAKKSRLPVWGWDFSHWHWLAWVNGPHIRLPGLDSIVAYEIATKEWWILAFTVFFSFRS